MKRISPICLAIWIAAIIAASMARADEYRMTWLKKSADWAVYRSYSVSSSRQWCGAETQSHEGTRLTVVGYENGALAFMLTNAGWHFPSGSSRDVVIEVGDDTFGAAADAFDISLTISLTGGTGQDLFKALQRGTETTISNISDHHTDTFSLHGSVTALSEFEDCWSRLIRGAAPSATSGQHR